MCKATYKCRACGEMFSGHVFENTGAEMINLLSDIVKEKIHICPDGSIGYADFVGFKKGGEPVPEWDENNPF